MIARVPFDPHSLEFQADPYSRYDELRALAYAPRPVLRGPDALRLTF